MAPKRKASNLSSNPTPAPKRTKKDVASTLVPNGPRVNAKKGVKNESLLHMLCTETKTGEIKELHFKKLVHANVNWDNADHIAKINSWRNQLYGRAGLKAKTVTLWHDKEEAYIELTYHLLVMEAAHNGLMIPKSRGILENFNNFFRGKVFQDADGVDHEPRTERKHNAFVSKVNRAVEKIKPRLESMLLGKSGDYFTPKIDEDNLDAYMKLLEGAPIYCNKKNMDEVFTWKVGREIASTTPYIDEWQTVLMEMLRKDPNSLLYDSANDPPQVDVEDEPNNHMGAIDSPGKVIVPADAADEDGNTSFIDTSIFSVTAGTDSDGDSELSDVDDLEIERLAAEKAKHDVLLKNKVDIVPHEIVDAVINEPCDITKVKMVDAVKKEAVDSPIDDTFKLADKTSLHKPPRFVAVEEEVAAILSEMKNGSLVADRLPVGNATPVTASATNPPVDNATSDTASDTFGGDGTYQAVGLGTGTTE
ncbi:hypothetical protein P280DRAFT_523159 [Massarina eburnea CBS 473.64]|uniref:Uncharacterized protein n=1 Tax=Massarina eburnea CBS 473.64 TaxID=1395130 RepID=A0A6A6RIS0_9PLEO|nr:hypothetical protein P280DRAFT_523159 [Massarina eburnea CBS 473.64]